MTLPRAASSRAVPARAPGPSGRLAPFFAPRGVAVVGASGDAGKVGGSVLANLRAAGFPGRVVPVNPRSPTVQGLPAVRSIRDAGDGIDLAVLAIPAPAVLPALQECAAAGIGGAVVITAGFRESGPAGREREAALRGWLRQAPIRVLGPNCLGWIRPGRRLNATFAPGMPTVGGIAFVSHSGALATAILDWSKERRLGFSLFASLGNQADLTEADMLDAVRDDAETSVIALYLEGVADGRRFREALRAAVAVKPVVVLKAGRSAEGAHAVTSHTGALAGSDRAFDAVIRDAGAVRVPTVEALFDLARALESQPLPRGRRLVVVTNGGGLGIVATDAAREAGLEVPPLAPAARERLRAVLPEQASLNNPVDLVGDADPGRYGRALAALGDDPADGVDVALILLTAQAATDAPGVARAVLAATRDWSRPVAAAFVGGARVLPGARALDEHGLPCYAFPEPAVTTLAAMARVAEGRGRHRTRSEEPDTPARSAAAASHLARLQHAEVRKLGLLDLLPVLDAYGITSPSALRAGSPEEAAAAAERLAGPVALKILSPDVTHKSDVGGVRVGLSTPAEVQAAAVAMEEAIRTRQPGARLDGFLVQRMAPAPHELLVGAVRDPQFGPLLVVGAGGIFVEVLRDTAARLAPVEPREALAMIEELRVAPILHGARGRAPADLPGAAEVVTRLGRLAVDLPVLSEIEINPLALGPDSALALDARATLDAGPAPS